MSKKLLVFLATAVVAATAMLVGAQPALANDTQCTNQVLTGTHDNVVVTPGTTCTLSGATLTGSYHCDGCAFADSINSTIAGNYTVKKAPAGSIVFNTAVGGNYEELEGGFLNFLNSSADNLKYEKNGPSTFLAIQQSDIRQNLQVNENSLFFGNITNNTVGENLQVEKNTGAAILIAGNTIGGNLQCKDNSPPATDGGNAVGGNDQC